MTIAHFFPFFFEKNEYIAAGKGQPVSVVLSPLLHAKDPRCSHLYLAGRCSGWQNGRRVDYCTPGVPPLLGPFVTNSTYLFFLSLRMCVYFTDGNLFYQKSKSKKWVTVVKQTRPIAIPKKQFSSVNSFEFWPFFWRAVCSYTRIVQYDRSLRSMFEGRATKRDYGSVWKVVLWRASTICIITSTTFHEVFQGFLEISQSRSVWKFGSIIIGTYKRSGVCLSCRFHFVLQFVNHVNFLRGIIF